MKRNAVLIALAFLIAVSTTFAQENTSNFLGTWKLETEKKSGLKSMTMTVSEDGGKLKIERNSLAVNGAELTATESYKIDEDAETTVIGGFMGGVQSCRLRILGSDKVQFLTTFRGDYVQRSTIVTWTISDDGKTLTVRSQSRSTSNEPTGTPVGYFTSKLVFTKQ